MTEIEPTIDNVREGDITRIDRPDPSIPTMPGTRLWARWETGQVEEYIVIDGQELVHLHSGTKWCRADFPHTVVPAPEPETVPVPAHLIREAERWDALPIQSSDVGVGILTRIVWAVREREGEGES